MAASAERPGEMRASGAGRERRDGGRVGAETAGGERGGRAGSGTGSGGADGEPVDLGAARPPAGRTPPDDRVGARRVGTDRAAPSSTAAGPASGDAGIRAPERPLWASVEGSGWRGSSLAIVALVALVGLTAALIAGLLAGAGGTALAGGAGGGLAVGVVVGLLCARLAVAAPVSAGGAGRRREGAPGGAGGVTGHGDRGGGRTGPGAGSGVDGSAGGGRIAGAADPGNLGPLLTSIGHRYQTLTDRQLAAFAARPGGDGAPAGATAGGPSDEDLAASRLARRMRRMAKTLQVLADDPGSWEAAAPATMAEVVAAAMADIDELAPLDSRSLHPASIEGEAVPDVVHLLAELIENAVTASSSGPSRVVVIGRRSTDGYVVSVVDEGSGMTGNQRERANAQLHRPPPLHQQPPETLGLATAGRLAARHGIAVTLLEAPTDGVIAKVRLPVRLLGGAPPERSGGRVRTRPVIDLTDRGDDGAPSASTATSALSGSSGSSASSGPPGTAPIGAAGSTSGGGAPADPATTAAGPLDRGVRRPEPGWRAGDGGGDNVDERGGAERGSRVDEPGRPGGPVEPLLDAAEARADLARRVQRSRPAPREMVSPRRDQRPVDTGHRPPRSGDTGPGDRPAPGDRPVPADSSTGVDREHTP